jgi:SAM-dependent methyltransferase
MVGRVSEQWAERAASFGSQAQAYAYGRPSYPLEAVRWSLPDGAHTVLDLAAGTGKLTQRLLELGLDVVAVEPLEQMRAFIPSEARALAGTAEAIPLPDESVDAVLVGQAYHWFDAARALPEIARVLRPGGTVGLLWNMDDDRVPWVARLCDLTGSEARATAILPAPKPPYDDNAELRTPVHAVFDHVEDYDTDRLVAMIASRSQTILLPPDDRAQLLDAVRGLAPDAPFAFPSICECWRGERRERTSA